MNFVSCELDVFGFGVVFVVLGVVVLSFESCKLNVFGFRVVIVSLDSNYQF